MLSGYCGCVALPGSVLRAGGKRLQGGRGGGVSSERGMWAQDNRYRSCAGPGGAACGACICARVCVCVCVCLLACCLSPPPTTLPERGGRSAAARPLKTARPSRSCLARQEGSCRDSRCAATGAGERGVGRRRPSREPPAE